MAFTRDQLVILPLEPATLLRCANECVLGATLIVSIRSMAPLLAATRDGQIAAVEWLLANGADVNAKYGDHIGPLEVALYHPNPEVVGCYFGLVHGTCRHFGISRKTFYKWRRRYAEHGASGLADRARAPHHSPRATAHDVVGKILYLRQHYHFGPGKIADYVRRFHGRSIAC